MASGSSRNASFLDYLHLSFAAEYSRDLKQRRTKIGSRFLSPVIPPLPPRYIHTEPSFQIEPRFSCPRYSKLAISLHYFSACIEPRNTYLDDYIFFHTYYISPLFCESESDSFFKIVKRNVTLVGCVTSYNSTILDVIIIQLRYYYYLLLCHRRGIFQIEWKIVHVLVSVRVKFLECRCRVEERLANTGTRQLRREVEETGSSRRIIKCIFRTGLACGEWA